MPKKSIAKTQKKSKVQLCNEEIVKKQALKFELKRQLFHIFIGLVTIFLLYYNIIDALIIFIILLAGIGLSLLCRKLKIPGIEWMLKTFSREEERRDFPGKGAIFFTAGVLLTVKLFSMDIALAAIVILTLGDAVSHLAGVYLGKTTVPWANPTKSIEGTLAGIAISFLAALFFVAWYEALAASIIAMAAEAVELDMNKRPVDDNIVVPLVAGTAVYLIRHIF